jgi:hypothetical protein
VVWYGLPNATDIWQPVDAGLGQMLKVLVGHEHKRWLDEEDNADRWYGQQAHFSAMERRILITHWVGNAWRQLCGPDYEHLRLRCWQKTGCLMTADGSEDEHITPEGLPAYMMPQPLAYLPVVEATPNPNSTNDNAVCEDSDPHEEEIDAELEEPDDDGEMMKDDETDRCVDAPFCGKKLRALYENGWYEGNVEYFNKQLRKYHVAFSDGTEDYIGEDEVDGMEIYCS